MSAARVWLAAGLGTTPEPTDQPTVSDDLMRVWCPGPDGRYTTSGGRRHATWGELRAQHDLVEVTAARLPEAIRWGWGAPPGLVGEPRGAQNPPGSGDTPVSGPAPRWGVSSLDYHAHALDPGAEHPVGVLVAHCGQMVFPGATLHEKPPPGGVMSRPCERCHLSFLADAPP